MTRLITSSNRKTNYFKFDLQTDSAETVEMVCYSPKKRKALETPYKKESPIKLKAKLNKARLSSLFFFYHFTNVFVRKFDDESI